MGHLSPDQEQQMELFKEAGTGVVMDALALAGLQGGVEGIHPGGTGLHDAVWLAPTRYAETDHLRYY